MVRAAVYIRVSTEEQAEEGYLPRSAAGAGCWPTARPRDGTSPGYTQDEGHSGRRSTPVASLPEDAGREGRWDTILVMKMDRIHRNSKNFMIMMEDLEKWGKKFTSMQEELDTSTSIGRFVVDMIQRIAQLESEQIGERTYMGMAQKAETGGLLGFNPPYGYHMNGESLIVMEAERTIVQSVFAHYLSGNTAIQIAMSLNQDSIATRRGKQWTVWSIGRMLHNPVYAGYLRWDGLILTSDHEAIIDVEDFNQVQARMASKTRRSKGTPFLRLKEDPRPGAIRQVPAHAKSMKVSTFDQTRASVTRSLVTTKIFEKKVKYYFYYSLYKNINILLFNNKIIYWYHNLTITTCNK